LLKLKKVNPETNEYNPIFCCEAKCELESEVIVASRKKASIDLPLCDKHWEIYCNLEENDENKKESAKNET
jgi:hypothetical protein